MNLAKMKELEESELRKEVSRLHDLIEWGIEAVESRDTGRMDDWAMRASDFLPDEQENK